MFISNYSLKYQLSNYNIKSTIHNALLKTKQCTVLCIQISLMNFFKQVVIYFFTVKAKSEIQQQKKILEHFAERYLKLDTIFVKCQSQSVNVRHKIEKHGQIQVQDRSEGLLRSFYNVFVIFINCYKFTIRFRLFPKSYWNSLAATKHNRFAASLIHII